MKFLLFLSALVGASAFAPATQSSKPTSLAATMEELEGMRGASVETGNKIFDPLGLAQWAPAEHLRKAELANGRSAMLATVGFFFPAKFGHFDGDVSTDPIKAFLEADPQWWAQFILFCGVIEGIKYRGEMEGKSFTGDGPAALDWTNSWEGMDDKQKEDMALKELKNGRLAMIGIAGFVSNYFIPGSVPGVPSL